MTFNVVFSLHLTNSEGRVKEDSGTPVLETKW